MLIKATYLNSDDLGAYIASAEGGLRESMASKVHSSHRFGGSAGVKQVANVDAGKDAGVEDLTTIKDTDSARLRRLIEAGRANPAQLGWIEVTQPDHDFASVGVGAMIDWECDISVSEFSAMMSMHDQIDRFSKIIEPAKRLGLDLGGIPDRNELQSMASMLKAIKPSLVLIGEDDDTEWRVAGSIDKRWALQGAEFDGFVRIIAKVIRRIDEGQQRSLLKLPGWNISREQRRKMERQFKADSSNSIMLNGPALMVDYLAIYS